MPISQIYTYDCGLQRRIGRSDSQELFLFSRVYTQAPTSYPKCEEIQ
jgi:hypothetical protein